jgi:hypothetical protein
VAQKSTARSGYSRGQKRSIPIELSPRNGRFWDAIKPAALLAKGWNPPFATVCRGSDKCLLRRTPRSQRNGGYGADCGRSRGGPCRGAIRPLLPFQVGPVKERESGLWLNAWVAACAGVALGSTEWRAILLERKWRMESALPPHAECRQRSTLNDCRCAGGPSNALRDALISPSR